MSENIIITHNDDHSNLVEDEFVVSLKSADFTLQINSTSNRMIAAQNIWFPLIHARYLGELGFRDTDLLVVVVTPASSAEL
jgi:hypothetical protein